jgi:hypothetical protein
MTCFFSVKKRDRQHGPTTCFLLAQSTGLGQRSAQPNPIPIHMWPVSLPSSLETSPVWSGRESLRVADLPATNRPETAHGPSPNPSHVPIPPPVSALPLNVYAQQSRSRQGLPIRLVWLQPKASLHRLFPPIKAPVRHPLPPALWLSSPRLVVFAFCFCRFLVSFSSRPSSWAELRSPLFLLLRLICVLVFFLPVPAQVPGSRTPPFDAGGDSSLIKSYSVWV